MSAPKRKGRGKSAKSLEIIKASIRILEEIQPASVRAVCYGVRAMHLVRVCQALQAHHGTDPFFISSRVAGGVLGICHEEAALMLRALVTDGVLTLVSKGAGKVASRYRYTWSI